MAMVVDESSTATVSRPMIALQPSWAGPSTMTIASFRPQGITYASKSLTQSAQAFTGQMGQPGPSTLMETRALISRLNLDPTIETMKSVHQQKSFPFGVIWWHLTTLVTCPNSSK